MATDRVATGCSHHNTADVYSAGGDLVGGDCRGCGKRYGLAVCSGCQKQKRLWVAIEVAKEVRRYCSEDCHQQSRERRQTTVGGKSRGRK